MDGHGNVSYLAKLEIPAATTEPAATAGVSWSLTALNNPERGEGYGYTVHSM